MKQGRETDERDGEGNVREDEKRKRGEGRRKRDRQGMDMGKEVGEDGKKKWEEERAREMETG